MTDTDILRWLVVIAAAIISYHVIGKLFPYTLSIQWSELTGWRFTLRRNDD
jgi:hypothetical protein